MTMSKLITFTLIPCFIYLPIQFNIPCIYEIHYLYSSMTCIYEAIAGHVLNPYYGTIQVEQS